MPVPFDNPVTLGPSSCVPLLLLQGNASYAGASRRILPEALASAACRVLPRRVLSGGDADFASSLAGASCSKQRAVVSVSPREAAADSIASAMHGLAIYECRYAWPRRYLHRKCGIQQYPASFPETNPFVQCSDPAVRVAAFRMR